MLEYSKFLVGWDHKLRNRGNMKLLLMACMAGVVCFVSANELTWRYTLEKPADGWNKSGADVSSWKEGVAPFSRDDHFAGRRTGVKWTSKAIWLVRTFEFTKEQLADKSKTVMLKMAYDEDPAVYINGVLALERKGSHGEMRDYPISRGSLATLKPGANTVAVLCRQTEGGQGIVVDLIFDGNFPPETEKLIEIMLGRPIAQEERYDSYQLINALEAKDELLVDWIRQDADIGRKVYGEELFEGGRFAENFRNCVKKAANGKPIPSDLQAQVAYYKKICKARRDVRLKSLAKTLPMWVFARHFVMGGSHYAYTEGQSDAQAERNSQPGGQLCLLQAKPDGTFQETVLLEAREGVIRDVDVDFDGKKILFAWRKHHSTDDYHLYESTLVNITNTWQLGEIKQLTEGVGVADYEGCYLPDGSIIFNSSRCVQTVDCWWTEVSNLYKCDARGKNLRRLTYDQVHDNYPAITWDGRILYTRWEYNDRSQMYPQPLYEMLQDGTRQTAVYGENSWFPTTIIHARAVPNSKHLYAIATGHHSRQPGYLIFIEPEKGRQEAEGVTKVAPVRETKSVIVDALGQDEDLFAYPYPLSEEQLVVTYNPVGRRGRYAYSEKFGIYWFTKAGEHELLATRRVDKPAGRAVPLIARKRPPQRPSVVDMKKTTGTFNIQDVYEGEPMKDVPRGTIKKIRVVQIDYRAAGIGENGNGGPGGAALVSTPPSINNGAWDPKIIIGDADVYADGSALFTVEAKAPVYFMLLDEKGRMVQTMRSWTLLQPGEYAGCVGCHENKNLGALSKGGTTKAMAKGAQKLQPINGPKRGFSFLKEVQPILNKHCVTCHDGKHEKTKFALTSEGVPDNGAKRLWTKSYISLTHRGAADHEMLNWISAASTVKLIPAYFKGSNKSKLFKNLDAGHCKTITPQEIAVLAMWVDLGVPFCGDYTEANLWNDGEKAKYERYYNKRKQFETP